MKRNNGLLAGGFALITLSMAAMPSSALAAAAVKLFDAVPVTPSGDITRPSLAIPFGSTAVVLDCDEAPAAKISGTADGWGNVFVDNFIAVNGTNVCAGGQIDYTADGASPGCFIPNSYEAVPPLNISASLVPGRQTVQFDLKDWGVQLGSSDVWLVTSCKVPGRVTICHKAGTPAEKTLNVGQSAIPDHMGHGDTLGACP